MNEVLNQPFQNWARSLEAATGGADGVSAGRARSTGAPKTGSQALLHASLDQAQPFAPAFDGAMSNHLPMALHAAWEMGADAGRLQALVAHERRKLEAAVAPTAADQASALRAAQRQVLGEGRGVADEWLVHRGQPAAYPWLQAYFSALLARQSAAQVLATHLELLLKSPHAFAFHGLIRTAHAWEGGHRGELAAALATWAAWWELLPTGAAVAPSQTLAPADWAQALRELTQGWRSELPMIIYRMRSAAETPVYAALAERLTPVLRLAQRREQLLAVAREAYLHSRNFTVLHMITGLRALRVLLPLLPEAVDQRPLVAALDRAAVAGWMAGRLQWQDAVPEPAPQPWPALHRAALAQEDEHVIKGVHACWQEDIRQPHPQWRQVAQRMLAG